MKNQTGFLVKWIDERATTSGVWKRAAESLVAAGLLQKTYTLGPYLNYHQRGEVDLSFHEIEAFLRDEDALGFDIRVGERQNMQFSLSFHRWRIDPSPLATVCFNTLSGSANTRLNWEVLIDSMGTSGKFIVGFLASSRYNAWSASQTPEEYVRRGYGDPTGWPTRETGVYPHLHQDIDFSKHPGRAKTLGPPTAGKCILMKAELWLGPWIWDYTTCTKEDVLAASFHPT